MSEFNKLQNIDGQVIDPTGLELDKGMFGTSINNTIPDSIKNRSMVIDSPFDKNHQQQLKVLIYQTTLVQLQYLLMQTLLTIQ